MKDYKYYEEDFNFCDKACHENQGAGDGSSIKLNTGNYNMERYEHATQDLSLAYASLSNLLINGSNVK